MDESQSALTQIAVANPHRIFDCGDEYFSIADLARFRCIHDRVDAGTINLPWGSG
jgi:hypothetical protein